MTTEVAHISPEDKEAASRLLADFQDRLDTVRRRTDLTDEGKAPVIAGIWTDTTDQIRAIRARVRGDDTAEIARLERRLVLAPRPLGASTGERIALDASYRDALARASAIEGDSELIDLLDQALLVEDDLLARAVAAVAYRRVRPEVLNHYTASKPELEADVDRLWELKQRAANDLTELHINMHLSMPPMPGELLAFATTEEEIRRLFGLPALPAGAETIY